MLLHFFLAPNVGSAQDTTSVDSLRTVEVAAPRLVAFGAGSKVERIDSTTLARHAGSDLATLLMHETPVFIKSYGLGSLATSTFRGGSAGHTAVLWNGFNIGSPMNGQMDLALIPMGVANDVRIQYGGRSALWGSGAVGGTIHLNDRPHFDRELTIQARVSAGSFNDHRQQLKLAFGDPTWSASLALLNASARNNFPYINTELPGSPEQRLTNADMWQRALIAQVHRRIAEQQVVHVSYWYQESERAIPPTMHQVSSSAMQFDGTHRLTGAWRHTGTRTEVEARAAWFDEDLLWYPFATDSVRSRSRTAMAEAEVRHRIATRHTVGAGLNATHARAVSDGYPDEPRQDRTALFLAYSHRGRNDRAQHSLSVRQEVMDGRVVPLTATVGSSFALTDRIRLRGTAAKVYRIPTFNDLFWVPGGDRDLLPESGYTGEVGVEARHMIKGWRISGEVTGFSRTLDNWIMWVPGSAYWTPQNIMKVWSRGLEARAALSVPLQRTTLSVSVLTNHVVSTNQVPKTPNDASVDKQLIYVPMYSGHARIGVQRGPLSATVQLGYTGYRYTSTDNLSYLEPFTLGSAWATYTLKPWKRHTLAIEAQANNLFDTVYQTIAYRPMPLRHYRVGLRLYLDARRAGTTPTP